MDSVLRGLILSTVAAFDAGKFDFDELMHRLAAAMFTKDNVVPELPETVLAAWNSLDDVHSIAASQSWSRPLSLELNEELRAEFERFRRVVEDPSVH